MPLRYTKDGEPYIDPAKLREPVTFLQQVSAADASGTGVSWVAGTPPDLAYAEVTPIRAADVIRGGQDVSKVWCTVTLRYIKPGRQAKERLQDASGNIYVIEAVENIVPGRKVYQQLTCELIGDNV